MNANVLYEPWLAAPFSAPFEWTDALNSPDPFSQGGGWTTFFGSLSEAGNWTVTLKNAGNTVVKTFSGTGTNVMQDWTGDDTGGASLPNGLYTYQLDATSVVTGQAS